MIVLGFFSFLEQSKLLKCNCKKKASLNLVMPCFVRQDLVLNGCTSAEPFSSLTDSSKIKKINNTINKKSEKDRCFRRLIYFGFVPEWVGKKKQCLKKA